MLEHLKDRVATVAVKIQREGLTWGPGGNVSAYDPETDYVVITPTGVPLEETTPDKLAVVDGEGNVVEGSLKPSSETSMHASVYRTYGERYTGIVHSHSPAATTLACLHEPIPPIHYLMGGVGQVVPVAPYASYGTPEMGERVIDVMGDGKAVLLANHGVLAAGSDVEDAAWVAETVEYTAELYLRARMVGVPKEIAQDEIDCLGERFKSYGQQSK